MKHVLGGVIVGLLIAGLIIGAAMPLLPPSARHPWVAWLIAGISVAGSIAVAWRLTRTPPR